MTHDLMTWRKMLIEDHGNPELLAVAPSDDVLDVPFYSGYGSSEGPEFLAWSATHVYFPVTYDGLESIGSAPRNPSPDGQRHVGGE